MISTTDATSVTFFLEELAKICTLKEIEHLAAHPSTPAHTLTHVAKHPVADVRVAVADNRNTPIEAIWVLVNDEDPDVRYQLAENHNLPKEVLTVLCEDDNPYVADRAQRTLERLTADTRLCTSSWRMFRKAEVERRSTEIAAILSLNPVRFIGRFYQRLSGYARAL